MSLSADQITIAITVYNRRQFVKQAIESALNQTIPVRVIVVEDCGPDPTLEAFIKEEFGSRIRYFRNSRRRGLFDNWNACLELCETDWISILHDDDVLEPCFVKETLALSRKIPDRDLYVGEYRIVDANGKIVYSQKAPDVSTYQELPVDQLAWTNPIMFPGQLFKVASALQLGGFRKTSQYCGDWEMWFKLGIHGGVAKTSRIMAQVRDHQIAGRGTGRVDLNGKRFPLMYAQTKRNLSLLRQHGKLQVKFDRLKAARQTPFTTKFLLANAAHFSGRMLKYNVNLFLITPAHSSAQRILKTGVHVFGLNIVKYASKTWRIITFQNK